MSEKMSAIRKLVEWPHAQDDQVLLNSELCVITVGDLRTLQREVDELREALEPFAREAANWPDYVPDSDGLFIASPDDIESILDEYAAECGRASAGVSFSNDVVTVGDLRRARALSTEEKKDV